VWFIVKVFFLVGAMGHFDWSINLKNLKFWEWFFQRHSSCMIFSFIKFLIWICIMLHNFVTVNHLHHLHLHGFPWLKMDLHNFTFTCSNVDERFIFTWSVNTFKIFIYTFIKGMSKTNICAQQLKITSS
jgi:hypothetical protein